MKWFTVIAALLASCATTPEWIVRYRCNPPPPVAAGLPLTHCDGLQLPYAACLYNKSVQCATMGSPTHINCTIQLERRTCGGDWVEVADTCAITNEPPEGAEVMIR